MIKAVIFDFGGVLVSEGFQNWISDNVAPYESIKHEMMPLQDKVDIGELPAKAYNEYLSQKTGKLPEKIEEEILNNYYTHKDVFELVKKLREKGMKTAIVSNFPIEWFAILRERYKLDSLFDKIFVSSVLKVIKPQPEFFQKALDTFGIQPDEAIFIDDKKRYTDAAKEIGIHGIVFTSEEQLLDRLKEFDLDM